MFVLSISLVTIYHAQMKTHVVVIIAMKGIFDFIDDLQVSDAPMKCRCYILPWCIFVLGWIDI